MAPKLKLALAERVKTQKRRSQSFSTPPLSTHAASLLLEAVFLKAKSLQALQRYKGRIYSLSISLLFVLVIFDNKFGQFASFIILFYRSGTRAKYIIYFSFY